MILPRPLLLICCCLAALAVAVGCGSHSGDSDAPPPIREDDLGSQGKIRLKTTAFRPGRPIPRVHTAGGDDLSPPLMFPAPPSGTKTWALICDDPDAPSARNPGPEPWVHWVIYNIPATTRNLSEGIPNDAELSTPSGARQGRNSWPSDNVGYRGPAPPQGSGPHRYFFKLYALDCRLELQADEADKQALLRAMQGHVLASGELIGTYLRR